MNFRKSWSKKEVVSVRFEKTYTFSENPELRVVSIAIGKFLSLIKSELQEKEYLFLGLSDKEIEKRLCLECGINSDGILFAKISLFENEITGTPFMLHC